MEKPSLSGICSQIQHRTIFRWTERFILKLKLFRATPGMALITVTVQKPERNRIMREIKTIALVDAFCAAEEAGKREE